MELNKARALVARRQREQEKTLAAAAIGRRTATSSSSARAPPLSASGSGSSSGGGGGKASSSGEARAGTASSSTALGGGGVHVVYESHLTRKYRCEQCGRLRFVDERLFKKFGATVCAECRGEHAQLYTTVLKTRAKAEFLIPDDALGGCVRACVRASCTAPFVEPPPTMTLTPAPERHSAGHHDASYCCGCCCCCCWLLTVMHGVCACQQDSRTWSARTPITPAGRP
jgi:hypothetical protein